MAGIRVLKKYVKTYVILIAVFFLFMALVYCIPSSALQENVDASLEVMEGEGDRPVYFFYRHSAIVDNFTDKVMYESLIPNREEYNFIQASVNVNQYPRYWHGYQVWLRPLTVIFQVQELRYIGMMVFHLLFFISAWFVAKRTNLTCAVMYVLSVTSCYIVVVPTCFQYLASFLVLFVSLIWLFGRQTKGKTMDLVLFLFVVGMVENFFDFLTYPLITLGVPLILMLWLRVKEEQADFKSNFWFLFRGSAAWCFGYAFCWIGKWAITFVVFGPKYLIRTFEDIVYRIGGSEEEPVDRIATIQRNLKAWMNVQDNGMISWSKVVMLLMVIAVILVIVRKLKDFRTIGGYVPILLVALYPYVWYLVLGNHSQIHFWFTYREQLITLFGGLIFLCSMVREKTSS